MSDQLTVIDEGDGVIIVIEPSTNPDIVVISADASGMVVTSDALPGPSAYQVALQNGFVGTEEQWLASLRPTGFNRQHTFSGIHIAEARDYAGALPLVSAGFLRQIWLSCEVAPLGAPLTLQLKKDGQLFGPEVSIPPGDLQAAVTGMSNAYLSGQGISISFTSVGTTPAEDVTILLVIEDA